MSKFFDDTMQGLLESIEIEKGNMPLKEKKGMLAPTYCVPDDEERLIDEFVEIRKEKNISQGKLAEKIGSQQQAISRIEKKEHSPSLKLFYGMVNALGYDLQLVKREM